MNDGPKIVHLKEKEIKNCPDIYSNNVNLTISVYDVCFDFSLKHNPEEDPEKLVAVRMSPPHAKVLALLLKKYLSNYEKDIGPINLPEGLTKELKVDRDL
jgi:hypothetical protein